MPEDDAQYQYVFLNISYIVLLLIVCGQKWKFL